MSFLLKASNGIAENDSATVYSYTVSINQKISISSKKR